MAYGIWHMPYGIWDIYYLVITNKDKFVYINIYNDA
jgi:hypothetical protein